MAKILKNVTASTITLSDIGVSIPAGSSYTVTPTEYPAWAATTQVFVQIANAKIVVNDGSVDLGISDAIDLLKGNFYRYIAGGTDGTIVGNVGDKAKIVNYGKASDGSYYPLAVDALGRLQLSPSVSGVNEPIVRVISINAGAADFYEYVVESGKTLQLYSYYAGGRGTGVASLIKHDDTVWQLLPSGGMESTGDVSAWAAVTGTFTSPSPDYNTSVKQVGTGSQRWIYASSGTALQRKQTFSAPIDVTGWRYIKAAFYCDAPSGGGFTRTISLILGSNGSTQTYSLNITNPGSLTPGWYELVGELDNPTSVAGTAYDPSLITDISLYMKDSANRSGTVYWDHVRFTDSITVLHRLYLATSLSSPQVQINPAETLTAGQKIYIMVRNTSTARTEFTSVVKGVLL